MKQLPSYEANPARLGRGSDRKRDADQSGRVRIHRLAARQVHRRCCYVAAVSGSGFGRREESRVSRITK